MTIETVYLSQKAKDQLIKVKRATGIQNWNILCRWAFCISLTDKATPSDVPALNEHAIEMSWKVFGGQEHEIYEALLIARCCQDQVNLDKDSLVQQLRCHLHRGIDIMANKIHQKGINGLFCLEVEPVKNFV